MRKFTVTISQEITVELDETKFTKEFVEEYNNYIGFVGDMDDFEEMMRGHASNIAELEARGVWDEDFTEGYGPPKELGIEVKVEYTSVDDIRQVETV